MTAMGGKRVKAFFTLIGTSLMLSTSGLYLFWGNLSIYTLSYSLAAGTSPSQIQSPWIMSVFLLAWALVVPLSGYLASSFGRRAILLLSIIIYNGCIAFCYYAIDISFTFFTILLGLFSGIGSGLSHGLLIEISIERTEKYVGVVSTIAESAMNVGAAIINQFVTMYVNPNYLTANWVVGPSKYFSQVEIIQRVPRAYLILGILSAAVQLLGFCLISEKSTSERSSNSSTVDVRHSAGQMTRDAPHDSLGIDVSQKKVESHSLKTILACKKFYALWVSSSICEASILVVFNYYKQVGRLELKNEDFLTLNGSVTIVVIITFSLVYGYIMDSFGLKTTFISLFGILTVASTFYVFTPLAGEWLYFIDTLLLMGWTSALDDLFGAATVHVFGQEHFTKNFGLIWSSCFITNLCAPPVIAFMLHKSGWHFLFNALAALNFIGLVLVIVSF